MGWKRKAGILGPLYRPWYQRQKRKNPSVSRTFAIKIRITMGRRISEEGVWVMS